MKTAKVTGVRDAGPIAPVDGSGIPADGARVERMAALLRRYPQLTSEEETELLAFLRKGRQIEIGLVGAREGVGPPLARFRRDHRSAFRLSPPAMIGFVLLVLVPLAAIVLIAG